ncbi:hypothetical protein FQA39_LY02370 [Lamprigera yunnana]|nr:hypothetical protein FQA39_LY02370 [Lamprigera yunnana]
MYLCFLAVFATVLVANANGTVIIIANPPKPEQNALMARYVIHNVDWVALSTISTISEIQSFPYASIEEVVDGIDETGNGIPYFFITAMDPFHVDVMKDSRFSLVASLASTDWCKEQQYEAEDPRCARVMMSGRYIKVTNNTEEYRMALDNMHRRHPKTKYWPDDHSFYISKMAVQHINLFDAFGGVKTVKPDEYFAATEDINKITKNYITK